MISVEYPSIEFMGTDSSLYSKITCVNPTYKSSVTVCFYAKNLGRYFTCECFHFFESLCGNIYVFAISTINSLVVLIFNHASYSSYNFISSFTNFCFILFFHLVRTLLFEPLFLVLVVFSYN